MESIIENMVSTVQNSTGGMDSIIENATSEAFDYADEQFHSMFTEPFAANMSQKSFYGLPHATQFKGWHAWIWAVSVYLVGLTCAATAINCRKKYRLYFVIAFCATGIEILRYVSKMNMHYAMKDTFLKAIIIQCLGAIVMILREGFVLTEEQKKLPWLKRIHATYKVMWNGRFINTARQAPVYHLIKDQENEKQVPSAVIEKRKELAERGTQKAGMENGTNESEVALVADGPNKKADKLWKRFSTYALSIWRNRRLRWMLSIMCRLLLIVLFDNCKDVVINRYLVFSWTDLEDPKTEIIRRFFRGDPVEQREFWVRVYFAFESVWAAYNWYNRVHLSCALLFVGLGIDEPEEWPHMFGDIRQAWNVRRFWSKYFDRLIYRTVNGTGEMIMQAVGLGKAPFMGKKRWLLNGLVFTISGFFHAYTDYLAGVKCGFWEEVAWWVSQYVAIVVETVFLHYLKTCCPRVYHRLSGKIGKTIGFIWGFYFLWWAAPKSQFMAIKCMER